MLTIINNRSIIIFISISNRSSCINSDNSSSSSTANI